MNSARCRFLFVFLLAFGAVRFVTAAPAPKADELLAKAQTKATEEHKNVFVIFDASW